MTLACAVVGHEVDNRRFAAEGPVKSCGCGRVILREDGSETRTRHTLSCFFGHHTYSRIATRHGHNEYMCRQCGHSFLKSERRLGTVIHPLICVALGHFVRFVERRDGYSEHCCRNCGHTFGFVTPAPTVRPSFSACR